MYAGGHDVLTSYNPRAKGSIPWRERRNERTGLSLFTLSLCSCFYLILNQQQQHRYFSPFYLTTKTFFPSFVASHLVVSKTTQDSSYYGGVSSQPGPKRSRTGFISKKIQFLKNLLNPNFFYSSISEISS